MENIKKGVLPAERSKLFYADDDISFDQFVAEVEKYDFAFLTMQPLGGNPFGKLKTSRKAKKIAQNKIEIYSGAVTYGPRTEIVNLPEIVATNHSNGYLRPFKPRIYPMPWLDKSDLPVITYGLNSCSITDTALRSRVPENKGKTCGIICEPAWLDTLHVQFAAPRVVAGLMLARLRERHGLFLMSAFEPECRLFHADSLYAATINPTSSEAKSCAAPVPIYDGMEIYSHSVLSRIKPFISNLESNLQQIAVNIQDTIVEQGAGQLECPLEPEMGMKTADDMFMFKQAIKGTATLYNMFASFMTVPLPNTSSSGNHFNHSLWSLTDCGKIMKNAFYEEDDPQQISDLARYWIGGILHHVKAIAALCAPTVNCYRRFYKAWTPDAGTWGLNDRFAALRVKTNSHDGTYLENRIPSAACCPYTVLAATVAAGMDGIERCLEPPRAGVKPSRPTSKDGAEPMFTVPDDMTDAEMKALTPIPHSLSEALNALEADKELIAILGEEFVSWFIRVKRLGELKSLSNVNIKEDSDKALQMERHEYLEFI